MCHKLNEDGGVVANNLLFDILQIQFKYAEILQIPTKYTTKKLKTKKKRTFGRVRNTFYYFDK